MQFVNVFRCCILSWDFLPVVLPAFLIAGAVPVFISTQHVLRFLGHRAKPVVAYAVTSLSGFVLSACSCNIVPLGSSIYRRGAGIGPAFAFLYAAPAVNFVSAVWTFQVVGLKMGLWRTLAVPVVSTLTGLTMAVLFWREEAKRRQEIEARLEFGQAQFAEPEHEHRHVAYLFCLLFAVLLLGGRGTPWFIRLPALTAIGATLAWRLPQWFAVEDLGDWLRETGTFLKTVLPLLIPAIVLIGFLQNNKATWKWLYDHIYPLMGHNGLKESYVAALIGSMMYFPVLTEIPLVKALLKEEMIAVGPALALLLNGPGVSLPGAILITRMFGWRKALAYEFLEVFFGGAVAYLFGKLHGAYHCPCQAGSLPTVLEDPSSMLAAVTMAVFIVIAVGRVRSAARRQAVMAA